MNEYQFVSLLLSIDWFCRVRGRSVRGVINLLRGRRPSVYPSHHQAKSRSPLFRSFTPFFETRSRKSFGYLAAILQATTSFNSNSEDSIQVGQRSTETVFRQDGGGKRYMTLGRIQKRWPKRGTARERETLIKLVVVS